MRPSLFEEVHQWIDQHAADLHAWLNSKRGYYEALDELTDHLLDAGLACTPRANLEDDSLRAVLFVSAGFRAFENAMSQFNHRIVADPSSEECKARHYLVRWRGLDVSAFVIPPRRPGSRIGADGKLLQ